MSTEDQETFNALDQLLKDEKTFGDVMTAMFDSMDADHSGVLERKEVDEFIRNIWAETGMKTKLNQHEVDDMFKQLDEDNSKTVSKDELSKFLRLLFEEQRTQLAKKLGKK